MYCKLNTNLINVLKVRLNNFYVHNADISEGMHNASAPGARTDAPFLLTRFAL